MQGARGNDNVAVRSSLFVRRVITMKNSKIVIKGSDLHRGSNPVALAMFLANRKGGAMKDRRSERGGSKMSLKRDHRSYE